MTSQISKSALEIGPLRFTYQVQDISIQEEKAVQVLPSTRTNKNFVSDSGATNQKAIVRLLFTGLYEINSDLRKLIALFRSCPIISVYNELISECWNLAANQVDPTTLTATTDNQKKKSNYTGFIPVALDELILASVPDIPYALYVTLTMTRVDVSAIYPNGELLYQGKTKPERSPYGSDAYYLNKWLDIALDDNMIPTVTAEDFSGVEISWYGEYSTGEVIEPNVSDLTKLSFVNNKNTKVYSESSNIKNLFSYKNCIGKGIPFPQHMGATSRFYSVDLLFADQENNTDFRKFCLFKESSDYIARAKDRFARVAGWVLNSPVAKLLAEPAGDRGYISGRPKSNTFVPLHVSIENGEQPLTKTVRLDMAESNIDFFTNSEVKLLQGGSDYEDLKKYFKGLVAKEYQFRLQLITNPSGLANAITGQDSTTDGSNLFDAFSTFWPIVNGNIDFGTLETFGILNRDTLKAVLLDSSFDYSERLAIALEATPLFSGKVATGASLPNIVYRVRQSVDQLQAMVFGPDEIDYANVYNIVKEYVQSMFDFTSNSTENNPALNPIDINNLTSRLFASLYGDYTGFLDFTNESGQAVQDLSKSTTKFSQKFINALFEVVVRRKGPIQQSLSKIYSVEGLDAAFLKLLIKYIGDSGTYPTDPSATDSNSTAINSYFKKSVYEDLFLPKYSKLYGDLWKEFAPTYDDLGIVNSSGQKGTNQTNAEDQLVLAVDENDTVPPSAWLFNEKYKPKLLAEIRAGANNVSAIGHELQLSLPFEVDDINEIEGLASQLARETEQGKKHKLQESLSKIIRKSFQKAYYNDETAYNETMNQLSIAALDKFEQEYMRGDKKLSVYVHHNNNVVRRKQLTVPGVAAEIYKVAKDYKLLRPNSRLPHSDTDEAQRSADRVNEFEFIRSLDENTAACLRSDLSQMPDIYENACKMFPAVKVYLLEKRGSDLYGDDTFFSVNPIMSVDITMDKDDADLAVITIADPLFLLQSSFFPQGGVVSVKGDDGTITKKVTGNLRGSNVEGYLKRYKIVEGRAIQIRLGYDSMPKNLKIAFTGKIVEISPGDVLTIVCQGWKSELINRQVNFYNDNVKNWGARDLAIMTMQHANPDGFGDFFPQMTSDYILKNLRTEDVQEAVKIALNRQDGVDIVPGARDVGNTITNAVKEFFGLESTTKQNQGLDTRLKNIWWADLPSYNNVVGWRNWSEIMPSQINDSWVVPLQPAWEVFKEASRHCWNAIVAVVPYDGEATLFFGHPDQPYIFTKGGPAGRRGWMKYINNKKDASKSTTSIIKGFKNSKEYDIQQNYNRLDKYLSTSTEYQTSAADYNGRQGPGVSDIEVLTDLQSIKIKIAAFRNEPGYEFVPNVGSYNNFNLEYNINISCFTLLNKLLRDEVVTIGNTLIGNRKNVDTYRGAMKKAIDNSSLPLVAYRNIQSKLGRNTIPVILNAIMDTPLDYIFTQWPGAETEFPKLLQPSKEISEAEINALLENRFKFTENMSDVILSILDTYKPYTEDSNNFGRSVATNQGVVGATFFEVQEPYILGQLVNYYDITQHTVSLNATKLLQSNQDKLSDKVKTSILSWIKEVKSLEDAVVAYSLNKEATRKYIRDARPGGILQFTSQPAVKDIRGIFDRAAKLRVDIEDNVRAKRYSSNENLDPSNLLTLKLFVYFFNEYLKSNDPEVQAEINKIKTIDGLLPPNMQVFRQHHWIDSDHDILKNDIVASTKDMWNTVIVEHPAHAEAVAKIDDEESLFKSGDFYSGIKWVYYPKQEVSGVMGLQFHPGLTLANKKLKIFTELNCQSNELAAKLACTHLADGIRRMYRGTLMLIGRNMKPHDRIIINDEYTKMTGPLEVESVVHHWSIDAGWVTNIGPQAVCDANPGAAILQTAAMEDTFNKVFKTIDWVSDAITIAIIVASLGGGTALAPGAFSVKEGIKASLKAVLSSGRTKAVVGRLTALGKNSAEVGRILLGSGGSPFKALGGLMAKYGGAANTYFLNWASTGLANQITHTSFRILTTSSFVENAQKTQQLPVILSPIYFNGLPFLAGMDTDDPIWAINFNDTFWSMRDLNKSAEQVFETIFGPSYVETNSTVK